MVNVGYENCVKFCEKGRNSFQGEDRPLESPVGELLGLSVLGYFLVFIQQNSDSLVLIDFIVLDFTPKL